MKLRYLFYGKLAFRVLLAVVCGLFYLKDTTYLDFSATDMWIGLKMFWCVILMDFILRFIPGKMHPIGMQKHRKRNFIPTRQYVETRERSDIAKKQRKELNKGALKVLIFYAALNGLWLILYCLGILRPQELFLIMLVYYVGDMICANGFCPFKLIFMKNRCCNVCRIYNWDAFMLVLPLLFVPGGYSYTLGAVAIVYTLIWEISFAKHPERFLESCNESISCKNCKHGMCPRRFPWNRG